MPGAHPINKFEDKLTTHQPMEFSPANNVVKLCIQGMTLEAGNQQEAGKIFMQAWNEATDDAERFIAAWYVARTQPDAADKLKWYDTDLQLSLALNDDAVKPAMGPLYTHIAQCYEELGDTSSAQRNRDLAASCSDTPTDKGPFYHGTKAHLKVGDMLVPGHTSNYQAGLQMNHIYFTALPHGAGLAAALAKGDGRERVYRVAPTGPFENDPNVTNNKFPGNPTRSYRTDKPLKVIGEISDWSQQSPEELRKWRDRLDNNKGEIIN